MKKTILLTLLCLCLLLTACAGNGEKETGTPSPTPSAPVAERYELSLADAVRESGAFSEDLEELDMDTVAVLYGIEINDLTEGKAYSSAGATAEEVAVLHFVSEDAAKAACKAMSLYVEGRAESYGDYLPAEVPKLENAVCEVKGDSVLLLVANDMDAAQSVLGG